jgi:hypothetical protein
MGMNKSRRMVRLYLVMLLLVLLPFAGFLWSVPDHHIYVALIGITCAVLVICIESIAQQTEREVMALQLKLNENHEAISEWKEKVRELDRIVALTTQENEEYRRESLTRAMHEAPANAMGAARVD